MQQFITGQKTSISDLFPSNKFQVKISLDMKDCEIDISCFGVDNQNQLSDDRYFIFYNQLFSPEKAITKEPNSNLFTIDLNLLPEKITRLIFTASIDGTNVMSQLKSGILSFLLDNQEKAQYSFLGNQFQQEKAIIITEIYKYNGNWKIAIVAKGFNGGLSALLAHFGGEEIKEESSPKNAPVPLSKSEKVQKIVLEKAPHLIDLTKKAVISLEKKNALDITAQVVLVLDRSGSMDNQYINGKVQKVIDKVLPLALLFDDNGSLESWAFASSYKQLKDATVENIKDYIITINNGWNHWGVGILNNEPKIMEELCQKHRKSSLPVYIIFISDGGIYKDKKIEEIIKKAAKSPIFWQFIGIGGSNYGILEKLDDMEGRYIDNANFFALDDIDSISDEGLYNRLMNEFPKWLKEAKQKNILY